MNEAGRTHIDLFSGIGGFALAAKWNGVRTVCFCEIEPECRAFLGKKYPGVPVHEDVRTFDGRAFSGAWLLTAGVPCQPVSCAGKRRGAADDRWLWPEALRIVSEARPAWVLFENPPGILKLGLDGILADLEALGYSAGVIDIPACALNSPQIRHRFWIVSHAEDEGRQGSDAEGNPQAMRRPAKYAENTNISDPDCQNAERKKHEKSEDDDKQYLDCGRSHWKTKEWRPFADGAFRRAKPGIRLLADGVSGGLLSALGNAIVPQVAGEIIRAMILSEEL